MNSQTIIFAALIASAILIHKLNFIDIVVFPDILQEIIKEALDIRHFWYKTPELGEPQT